MGENEGRRASNQKSCMSAGTWQLTEERRQLKDNLNRARTRAQKRKANKSTPRRIKRLRKDARETNESLRRAWHKMQKKLQVKGTLKVCMTSPSP